MNTLSENAYFKLDDLQASEVMGFPIPADWWSRVYEYPWALQYAAPGLVVADMGAGWQFRPFKNALAQICEKVYAVDWGTGLLEQETYPNMELVVDGLTHRIQAIPEGSLDRVFCISVLEELGDENVPLALAEFYTCLKPGGLCVLTLDMCYDINEPMPSYPGVDMYDFINWILPTGFRMREPFTTTKDEAVYNEAFNLCVYHCVLERPA